MTDNQFWIRFWCIIFGTICLIAFMVFISNQIEESKVKSREYVIHQIRIGLEKDK